MKRGGAPLDEGDFRDLTCLREILGAQRRLAVALNASSARAQPFT